MLIKDIIKEKGPTISFEIFPPKNDYPLEKLYNTIEELKDLNPDFISVTYGAGGSTKDRTVEIASKIKNDIGIETMAHLTCLNSSENQLDNVLKTLKENNIENILALRGDYPSSGEVINGDFSYAKDLVNYINSKDSSYSLGGACYPEGHIENENMVDDLRKLKEKCDSGLDFLITQLFFDNELFYQFLEKLELLNIKIPVIPGILPVLSIKQVKTIQKLSGCNLPPKFLRILDKYEDNPIALKEAGIAYATEQIIDLISYGVDGIHLYTMNKSKETREIFSRISNIRDSFSKV
ncbi:MAG: methylenetetrahydrofolate reductase [NAD(P)H] [Firmicutes bacterium]|jgi:methylenetetrahydrofolate reductase (NADPH)|nr:methylenetetrahydrofolate reductase [NAD(P)H] [Bacillota bacterium]